VTFFQAAIETAFINMDKDALQRACRRGSKQSLKQKKII